MTMPPTRPGTRFDLHLHTDRSDGRFSQEEVLDRCARGGLEVIALTDHDFAPDLQPGVHQLGSHRLHVLAGAEVTGVHDGRELHLLVYFPGDVPTGFREFCRRQTVARARRYALAVDNLGLPDLAAPDARALGGDKALTRLHLAHALVDSGHATDVRDAFTRWLGKQHGHVPQVEFPFVEAIRTARAHGGVTSWAHPVVDHVRRYLPTFVAAGLQGLEVLRPRTRGSHRRALRRMARQHGLLITGGSDWHGWHDQGDLGLFSVRGHEIRAFLDALDQAA